MKKYEFTGKTSEELKQIRALIDIPKHNVKKGDIGGWIESEYNLSHKGDCWIESGEVYGTSVVSEDAHIVNSNIKNSMIAGSVEMDCGTIEDSIIWGKGSITQCNLKECIINRFIGGVPKGINPKDNFFFYMSELCDVVIDGSVFINNSTIYSGKISGIKTKISDYSLKIRECKFTVGDKYVKDLNSPLLYLENEENVLELSQVDMEMDEAEYENQIYIIGFGRIHSVKSEGVQSVSILGDFYIDNVFIKNSSLDINHNLESFAVISGVDSESPVVFDDVIAVINSTTITGSPVFMGNSSELTLEDCSILDYAKITLLPGGSSYSEFQNLSMSEMAELTIKPGYDHSKKQCNIELSSDDNLVLI